MRITRPQARRIALAAQGFGAAPSTTGTSPVTIRQLQRVIDTVKIIQIDSVNVVTRSHYLPFFSRLGSYDVTLLDRARDRAPRRLVETWAHEASLVPPQSWPLHAHRRWRPRQRAWLETFEVNNPGLLDALRMELAVRPPSSARSIEAALDHDAPLERTHWGWNWSVVKEGLELLFGAGEAVSAGRNSQFERLYTATSRVLGDRVAASELTQPTSDQLAAQMKELVRQAIAALGIGSAACIRDYFRLTTAQTAPALAELVAAGEVEVVQVPDWGDTIYLDPAARRPRKMDAQALLSPFDSLVWFRTRAEQLFNFHYRIEIYTPQAKRIYGYYVLPFVYGENLVARCDVKADRAAGALRVHATHWEPGADSTPARAALMANLESMAQWLGLESVAARLG